MNLGTPGNSGAASLEAIARDGSLFKRIAVRIPTYLTDLRENPAWLPMFVLARTMPGRRMHWLGARRARPLDNAAETIFAGVDRQAVVEALRSDGLFSGLMLPQAIREEIAAFARRTPCFGNFDRRLEFMPGEHAEAEKRLGRSLLSASWIVPRPLPSRRPPCFSMSPGIISAAKRS